MAAGAVTLLLTGPTVIASGCDRDEGAFEEAGEGLQEGAEETRESMEEGAEEAGEAGEEVEEELP